MAPRWFRDGGNKRASILSFIDHKPFQSANPDLEPTMPPSLMEQDSLARKEPEQPSAEEPTTPRKRLSMFARSTSTNHEDTSDHSRAWPRIFGEPTSVTEMAPSFEPDPFATIRRNPRRSIVGRSARHEPIVKWMRKVERSSFLRDNTSGNTDELSRDLRKSSISEPFNFQHVTHHRSAGLPELDFSSERDLTRSFWAACAHQVPQGDLQGIRAEDLPRFSASDAPTIRASSTSTGPTSPHLRPSQSFPVSNTSNTSTSLDRSPSRASALSHSASLATIISEQRDPPKMVHPAYRSVSEPIMPTSTATSWLASPMQTPVAETVRNLEVVPEEGEASAVQPIERDRKSSETSVSSFYSTEQSQHSDAHDANSWTQYETSAPSLSSGETWEEDVDFCYNMEAEATSNFQWQRKNKSLGPQDSAIAPPAHFADYNPKWDVSPRVSMANHIRNKSSMTMTPLASSPLAVSTLWGQGAFENPRPAPRTPSTEPEGEQVHTSATKQTIDLRSSEVLTPEQLKAALRRLSDSDVSGVSCDSPLPKYKLGSASLEAAASSAVKTKKVAGRRKHLRLSSEAMSQAAPSPPPSAPLPPVPTESTMSARASEADAVPRSMSRSTSLMQNRNSVGSGMNKSRPHSFAGNHLVN